MQVRMTSVQTVGIFAAATRINDDYNAIARAQAAQCHQLRILHNIHIRDSSGYDGAEGKGHDNAGTSAKAGAGPRGPIHGRGFSGQPDNVSSDADNAENRVWGDASQTDTDVIYGPSARNNQGGSGGQDRISGRNAGRSRADVRRSRTLRSSSSSTSRGWWCLVRDVVLAYSFFGVTGLIIYLWLNSYSQSGMSAADGTYDAVI